MLITKKANNPFNQRMVKCSLSIIFLSMILAFALTTTCLAEAGGSWWDRAQQGGLEQVGEAYDGGTPNDIRVTIADIIKIILGFLGIMAVVLVVYAGFKWMLSRGNEEQVSDAKNILLAGVIGLVIILSAYLIANFVINQIYGATTGERVLFP